jgi:hypothetical protein
MGFLDLFRAVACKMYDFLNHSVQRKSSVHLLGDIETLNSIPSADIDKKNLPDVGLNLKPFWGE